MDPQTRKSFIEPLSFSEDESQKYQHGFKCKSSGYIVNVYFLKNWDKNLNEQDRKRISLDKICKWLCDNEICEKVEVQWIRKSVTGFNGEISVDDEPSHLYSFKNSTITHQEASQEVKLSETFHASSVVSKSNLTIFHQAPQAPQAPQVPYTLDLAPLMLASSNWLSVEPKNEFICSQSAKILDIAKKPFFCHEDYVVLWSLAEFSGDFAKYSNKVKGKEVALSVIREMKNVLSFVHKTLKNEDIRKEDFQKFKVMNTHPAPEIRGCAP